MWGLISLPVLDLIGPYPHQSSHKSRTRNHHTDRLDFARAETRGSEFSVYGITFGGIHPLDGLVQGVPKDTWMNAHGRLARRIEVG
jgi:hypothetical protein